MTRQEYIKAVQHYSDPYIQEVSRMSASKMGGELRWLKDIASGRVNYLSPEKANEKSVKVIDASMLYFARGLLNSLSEQERIGRAQELKIPVEDLDEYYLLTAANLKLHEFMITSYGISSPEQYIQQRGFENFIAFVRGSSDKMFNQPQPKKKWWQLG